MQVNIGKGIELEIDVNKFNPEVLAHVIYIGCRNILMDSHAGNTKDADGDNFVANSRATAERKLEAMYAGEVRVAGSREGDPVRAEAIRIATGHIKTALRKAGRKIADVDAKVIREKAIALLDKNPSIMTLAAKRVAEAKAVEIDAIEI